jgi:integrase
MTPATHAAPRCTYGASLWPVIAKWLGHADASITARIYTHSQDDALRAAGVTLGQVVTPGA